TERRVPLVELRSRRAEKEQRHVLGPVREMLQKREQGLICPVEILKDEDVPPRLRPRFEAPPPGHEGLLVRGGLSACPHERLKSSLEPGPVGILRRKGAIELRL